VRTARHVGRELYENALSGLSQAERDRLSSGLIRIKNNLNNMTAEEKEAV
jgi:hypothetical protein